MIRIGTSFLMICFAALLVSSSPAAGEDLSIKFEGDNFSAHVEDYPLQAVADKIEKKTGIWFKARDVLLQEKVFADFNDLPLEEGLEVILSKMNYSLVFDRKDDIVGVFLFGSLAPTQRRNIRRVSRPVRRVPRIIPRRIPRRFGNFRN
jgi:hypothetical protein